MHLLEALLAAYEAFDDGVFRARAASLIDLFAARLFQPVSGVLPEFFGEDWEVVTRAGGFLVEPGHHCEWVWLLHRAEALGVRAGLSGLSDRLMEFVDRYGIDPVSGGIFDEVFSDGTVVSRGSRLWPQTERLRAEHLAGGRTDLQRLAAFRCLAAYLRPDGLWHERRRADGDLSDEPAPASSLYHLTGAILSL
jgi:mannose-6-phosphate isomerase